MTAGVLRPYSIGCKVAAYYGVVGFLRHNEGLKCGHQNDNTHFKKVLAEYTPPLMDRDIHGEFLNFVNRRKSEGGAPIDFSKIYAISSKMNLHQARV